MVGDNFPEWCWSYIGLEQALEEDGHFIRRGWES